VGTPVKFHRDAEQFASGMPGCLSVGMNAAKSLAAALKKPLVGVHHMVQLICFY
jgi:tRNA A37 threonylcarbamoyltransferase TsaD